MNNYIRRAQNIGNVSTIRIPHTTRTVHTTPPAATEEEPVTAYHDRLTAGEYSPGHAEDAAATKAAEAKAQELGVNLADVSGSGKGGKVTVPDVEAAAAESQADNE